MLKKAKKINAIFKLISYICSAKKQLFFV